MTQMILPAQASVRQRKANGAAPPMHVSVFIQADVIDPATAQHKANVWLAMNAGHLLSAEEPELVLGQPLCWRFAVVRAAPQRDLPGAVSRAWIGYMQMEAVTGDVIAPESLIEELTANADALTSHTA